MSECHIRLAVVREVGRDEFDPRLFRLRYEDIPGILAGLSGADTHDISTATIFTGTRHTSHGYREYGKSNGDTLHVSLSNSA